MFHPGQYFPSWAVEEVAAVENVLEIANDAAFFVNKWEVGWEVEGGEVTGTADAAGTKSRETTSLEK